uniref:Uncharacterized protein n=1 Tax=Chromera velia CCMP2878 TaxID=1169474 RepID=A0A0G4HQP2_9ALVE|mmetsp:Transcript_4561/g.9152  ORF Transcript_4561/g.9152 Transcript_4561/m.9152 type:complete len:256 (+) Transcript_4561:202-969(+)|eukprot:Cvel_1249.t1-p1 / transcript=Cvel_1249.t1 / gene=Cvel_1249 / organism=Chromera_velia_CCMP2878 / gene_product=hypothetical protein / transcript_product=hypothetical protein / location=Cvel_scaffold42:15601-16365(-) / protein_length=255 / sequence_SO=supercontig / SO=protein_coding / is_pseudo=false
MNFAAFLLPAVGPSAPHHADGHHGKKTATPQMDHPIAFPEHTTRTPITPKQDDEFNYKQYKWGYKEIPDYQEKGAHAYKSIYDNKKGHAIKFPWAADPKPHHENSHPENDRISGSYETMLADKMPLGGFTDGPPSFSSRWEKMIAYHHGLYAPSRHGPSKSADEIRLAVNEYSDHLNAENPKDTCKYLAIEYKRCSETHQAAIDPEGATTKCFKWADELDKCKWDAEKMKKGLSYIERRNFLLRGHWFFPEVRHQ